MKPLKDLGVEVIGVSGDSVDTQALFKKAHKLPYTLLADYDGAVGKALGVKIGKGGTIKRNVLYHSGVNAEFYNEVNERRFPVMAAAKDAETDYNIYYTAGNPELSQTVLDKKQREGIDANSLATDPLFVDPENGDFRFQPGSPALKMGIVPIDLSKIGLRK